MNASSRAGQMLFTAVKTWATGNTIKLLGRETWNSMRIILILLILCGVIYPLILFGVGQLAFNQQANGSLIRDAHGQVIGSELIGQYWTKSQYFHGRPSATVNPSTGQPEPYAADNSAGANLGPTNPQLIEGNGREVTVAPGTPPPTGSTPVAGKPHTYYVPGTYLGVKTYAELFRKENGLSPNTPLPADIITASGSGLDPDISVEAALLQVNRVVNARRALGGKNAAITPEKVKALIAQDTQARDLGILGEPRVNVLELNLALDATYGPPTAQH
jgi:potassium-transporting ATPase KdpC subunit